MKIGLFDSGVGGLTILKKMIERHPNHHYIYYGDSLNLPYGNKSREDLLVLADNNIRFLLSHGAELIIVACGTVSSNIDDEFKSRYNVQIIDIITPSINYINKNEYNSVGVIATNMTINSGVFKGINKVKAVACPDFVPLIESGLIDTVEMDQSIDLYLGDMKEIDALLLGCTHYPLIKDKLSEYFGNIELIDIGYIIANDLVLDRTEKPKVDVYFSSMNDNIVLNTCKILGNFQIKEE